MQSLWSRAAGQAHNCGCRSCHQVTSAMTRPSTTRAVRRKVTFGEVFTAFYTSIMGTAAVVDAKFKDDRRKDLDRQIQEVKADLERLSRTANLMPTPDPSALPPSGDIQNRYKGCWAADKRQQRGRGVAEFFDSLGEASEWQKTLPRSTELDAWWKSSGLPEAETNMSTRVKKADFDAIERQIRREEQDDTIDHRQPKSDWQLYHRVRDTHGVVTELLRAVDLHPIANRRKYHLLARKLARSDGPRPDLREQLEDWYQQLDSEEPDPLRHTVRRLYAEYHPRYKIADLDIGRGNTAWANSELNDTIRAIFARDPPIGSTTPKEDLQERVLEICHHLLTGTFPPTIHTFSTLMNCLDRIGQHEASNKMLVYIMYISRLEPTQGVIVALFNHYKVSGNIERFAQLIRRCTARDKKNMMIRSKSLAGIARNDQLQKWVQIKDVILKENGFVKERVWFSNSLINAIIEGLLWYDCLGQAVRVVAWCWGRGIRVLVRSMLQLMDQCVDDLDEDAALAVLKAFFRSPHNVWPSLTRTDKSEMQARLQRLMDFCGIEASLAELLGQPANPLTWRREARARKERRRAYRVLLIKRGTDVAQAVIEGAQAAIEAFEAFEEAGFLDTTTEAPMQEQEEEKEEDELMRLGPLSIEDEEDITACRNMDDMVSTLPSHQLDHQPGHQPGSTLSLVHEEEASHSASRERLSSAYGP